MQFAIGALAMRGAGCTINDMWDRYNLIIVLTIKTIMQLIETLISMLRGPKQDH